MVRMPSIPFLDNGHSDEHSGYQSDASEAKGHVDRAAFFWIQTTNRETLEVKQKKIKFYIKRLPSSVKMELSLASRKAFTSLILSKNICPFFQTFQFLKDQNSGGCHVIYFDVIKKENHFFKVQEFFLQFQKAFFSNFGKITSMKKKTLRN